LGHKGAGEGNKYDLSASRYRQVEQDKEFYEEPKVTLDRLRQLEIVATGEGAVLEKNARQAVKNQLVHLEEVAEFINGRAFKPSDWSDSGLPIIRIQNLTEQTKPLTISTALLTNEFGCAEATF